MKVEEGFFLDWVHGHGCRASVGLLNQLSRHILTDVAEAVLANSDVAVPWAKVAVDAPVGERLPPACAMKGCRHTLGPVIRTILRSSGNHEQHTRLF